MILCKFDCMYEYERGRDFRQNEYHDRSFKIYVQYKRAYQIPVFS